MDDIDLALAGPGFPSAFLADSLAELADSSALPTQLAAPYATSRVAASSTEPRPAADFVSLDGEGAAREAADRATIAQQAAQIEHLKKLQRVAHAQLATLAADKAANQNGTTRGRAKASVSEGRSASGEELRDDDADEADDDSE